MTFQVATCVSSRRVSFVLLVLLSVTVIITYSCYIAFIILPSNRSSTDSHNNSSSNDTNNDSSNNNDDDNSNSSSSNNLSSEYDPEVAWRGLHYCKAAYCPTETLIDWSCGETCDEVRFFEPCFLYLNASFGTLGFAGLDHMHHKIVLAFRGSSNIANWIEDLSYWAIPYPSESCGSECMVHRGFYHSYMSLQPYVLMDMADLHMQYPSYTLLVTGHSLGAALALLSALDLTTWNDMATEVRHEQLAKVNFVNVHDNLNSNKDEDVNLVRHISLRNTSHTTRSNSNLYDKKESKDNNKGNISSRHKTSSDTYAAQSKNSNNNTKVTKEETQNRNIKTSRALAPIEVYTFGEPRVGDVHFSLWSTNVLSIHQQFRVTHGRDVVPHLPPQSSNYVHVPQELWYNNSYKDERESDDEDNLSQSSNDHIESNIKIDSRNNKINNRGINRLTMNHVRNVKKDEENTVAARHNSNHSSLSYRICTDNATSEDYNCSNSV